MKDSAELLGRLVRNLPGMAYRSLRDADWTLEFVSDGSMELLGYSPDELVVDRKVAVSDLTHPDDLAQVSLQVHAAVSEQRPFCLTYRMLTASGETKHISEVGHGIFREDGSLEALEGFLTDATARVKAETALITAQRREVLGGLATGIAHDLNNLLSALYGVSDLLMLEIAEEDPMRTSVEIIVTITDKAKELTQQLHDLGKPPPPQHCPSDLNGILKSQLRLLTELAGPSEVVTAFAAETLPAAIEPARFEQVLRNLVGNARDAIDGAGKIDLRLARSGDQALLEVRDNGAGMTAAVQAKAFDPFFTTKVPGRGTGLGLAIISDVVTDCGGKIEVDSELGKGTVFKLLFPLVTHEVPK